MTFACVRVTDLLSMETFPTRFLIPILLHVKRRMRRWHEEHTTAADEHETVLRHHLVNILGLGGSWLISRIERQVMTTLHEWFLNAKISQDPRLRERARQLLQRLVHACLNSSRDRMLAHRLPVA